MRKHSQTKFNNEARTALIKGAGEVYKAVGTTLGPKGRNIVIWKPYRTKVIHDGINTAKEIEPQDPFENAGANILKQAGQRQVKVVGDGTTVAIVLGYAIASEALKIVESGVNPMSLRSGLEKGRDILIDEIKKLAIPLKTRQQKIEIATISSGDEKLGELIGDTWDKAGVDGVVTVEDSIGPEAFVDHEDGLRIDSGYKTEYFVTNPENMTATVSKARILVTDYKLDNIQELMPLLQDFTNKKETAIVFIGQDIEGSVLGSLVQTKIKGGAAVLAIKAPSYQMDKTLQDLAIAVGAKFISKDLKMDLKKVVAEDLGYAERVTSSKEATVIISGGGDPKTIKDRVDSIKHLLDEEENDFNKQKLRERLAKLTSGVYVVHAGGNTEVEVGERKERADDAVLATQAAMRDGIVPGGEVVYLKIRDALKPKNENEDYAYRILKNALFIPFDKLLGNAGMNAGEHHAYLKDRPFGWGIDLADGGIKNLSESGIVDPALVSIEAIKNAVSVAVALITSDGVVCEVEEEKK